MCKLNGIDGSFGPECVRMINIRSLNCKPNDLHHAWLNALLQMQCTKRFAMESYINLTKP